MNIILSTKCHKTLETKMSSKNSEIIIIDCVENNVTNQTKIFGFKNKRKHRRCKRKVKLFASADDDKETLDTQKVGVKKQRITCIIDIESIEQIRSLRGTSTNRSVMTSIELNTHRTEVTEYRNNKKIQDCYHLNPSIKRVVPQCFRQTCKTLNNSLRTPYSREKISKFADRFVINAKHHRCAKLKRRHQHHSNNRISFAKRWESKLGHQQRAKHKRCSSRKEHYKDMLNYHKSLTPISLSPLKDSSGSTITYEDISSVNNLSCSSEDLDTLIRRTKRREKNKVGKQEPTLKQSNRQEEEIIQISSDEESEDLMTELSFCSELEASVHSRVTLRLAEVDEEAYSPTMHPNYINEYSSKTSSNFINNNDSSIMNNGYIQCFEEVYAKFNKVEKKDKKFNINTTIKY